MGLFRSLSDAAVIVVDEATQNEEMLILLLSYNVISMRPNSIPSGESRVLRRPSILTFVFSSMNLGYVSKIMFN